MYKKIGILGITLGMVFGSLSLPATAVNASDENENVGQSEVYEEEEAQQSGDDTAQSGEALETTEDEDETEQVYPEVGTETIPDETPTILDIEDVTIPETSEADSSDINELENNAESADAAEELVTRAEENTHESFSVRAHYKDVVTGEWLAGSGSYGSGGNIFDGSISGTSFGGTYIFGLKEDQEITAPEGVEYDWHSIDDPWYFYEILPGSEISVEANRLPAGCMLVDKDNFAKKGTASYSVLLDKEYLQSHSQINVSFEFFVWCGAPMTVNAYYEDIDTGAKVPAVDDKPFEVNGSAPYGGNSTYFQDYLHQWLSPEGYISTYEETRRIDAGFWNQNTSSDKWEFLVALREWSEPARCTVLDGGYQNKRVSPADWDEYNTLVVNFPYYVKCLGSGEKILNINAHFEDVNTGAWLEGDGVSFYMDQMDYDQITSSPSNNPEELKGYKAPEGYGYRNTLTISNDAWRRITIDGGTTYYKTQGWWSDSKCELVEPYKYDDRYQRIEGILTTNDWNGEPEYTLDFVFPVDCSAGEKDLTLNVLGNFYDVDTGEWVDGSMYANLTGLRNWVYFNLNKYESPQGYEFENSYTIEADEWVEGFPNIDFDLYAYPDGSCTLVDPSQNNITEALSKSDWGDDTELTLNYEIPVRCSDGPSEIEDATLVVNAHFLDINTDEWVKGYVEGKNDYSFNYEPFGFEGGYEVADSTYLVSETVPQGYNYTATFDVPGDAWEDQDDPYAYIYIYSWASDNCQLVDEDEWYQSQFITPASWGGKKNLTLTYEFPVVCGTAIEDHSLTVNSHFLNVDTGEWVEGRVINGNDYSFMYSSTGFDWGYEVADSTYLVSETVPQGYNYTATFDVPGDAWEDQSDPEADIDIYAAPSPDCQLVDEEEWYQTQTITPASWNGNYELVLDYEFPVRCKSTEVPPPISALPAAGGASHAAFGILSLLSFAVGGGSLYLHSKRENKRSVKK